MFGSFRKHQQWIWILGVIVIIPSFVIFFSPDAKWNRGFRGGREKVDLGSFNGKPIQRDRIEYLDPPVWRRWYVVGPAAVGLAILTGVVVGYTVHDFPGGSCHKVGSSGPC